MKRRITINHRHARSVRSDLSMYVFTRDIRRKVAHSFSPLALISPDWVTLSGMRGAEQDAIGVVRIVVAVVTVAIDVTEIAAVAGVRRPKPPVHRSPALQCATQGISRVFRTFLYLTAKHLSADGVRWILSPSNI